MIELRQRSTTSPRTSRSGISYVALSSDDELDQIPVLNPHRYKPLPQKKSTFCESKLLFSFWLKILIVCFCFTGPKCCFTFSLMAIIFLSIVAYLLWVDSLYFKVSKENEHRKPELVNGVLGAVVMYIACLGLSGYMWFKSTTLEPLTSPRFME